MFLTQKGFFLWWEVSENIAICFQRFLKSCRHWKIYKIILITGNELGICARCYRVMRYDLYRHVNFGNQRRALYFQIQLAKKGKSYWRPRPNRAWAARIAATGISEERTKGKFLHSTWIRELIFDSCRQVLTTSAQLEQLLNTNLCQWIQLRVRLALTSRKLFSITVNFPCFQDSGHSDAM